MLSSHGFLSLLSYSTQSYQSRNGTTHSRLSLPCQSTKKCTRSYPQTNLLGTFSHLGFLSKCQNDSSLCQVNIKLANTFGSTILPPKLNYTLLSDNLVKEEIKKLKTF